MLFWIGACLVVIGLVGIIVPILPGIIPIIFGAGLIARSQESFEEYLIKRKFQAIKSRLSFDRPRVNRAVYAGIKEK